MAVFRTDRGELSKPVREPNGWLRVDGLIARAGILEYKRQDGSTWVEYRPADENASATPSFDGVPFTNSHPAEGLLTAENTRHYQVGTVLSPKADGDRTRASILVTDAAAIKDLEDGKQELSCGYLCDVDHTPGTHNGKRYDAVQRNVRGNHVALVSVARAGPEFRVRMDSLESQLYISSHSQQPRPVMVKIRIDGVEYEVSESASQAIAKHDAAQAAELAKTAARADSAEATARESSKALQELPGKIRAEVKARADLELTASNILGEAPKTDSKDMDIKRACIERVNGLRCDGKSDAYVDAAFDLAVKAFSGGTAPADNLPRATVDQGTTLDQARAKFQAASRNAHQRKA